MNEEIIITIQGWETNTDNPETIVDDLKEYATEVFGWTETVPDPENEGQTISNPKSYIKVIFNEKPMGDFWIWLKNRMVVSTMNTIDSHISTMQGATNVTTE